jgi:hypothetical protein
MMLAQTKHVDVPHNNHLVVVFRKHRVIDHIHQPLLVPLGHPHERLGVPLGRALQALAVRVLADALEDGAQGGREDGEVGGGLGGGKVEALFGQFGWGSAGRGGA